MSMDLDKIIDQLDIETFYASLGVKKLTNKGYCHCPFCQGEKKLKVTFGGDKKGLWKCFKCEESGNAITMVAKLQGCSNGEAVKYIKKHLGIVDEPKKGGKVVPIKPKHNNDISPESEGPPLSDSPPISGRPRDIYTKFVELCPLAVAHREELKSKRGLRDAIIDDLKFRSGGDHVPAIIEELRKEFTDQELQHAGLLVEANTTLIVNKQLMDPRVLIPYFDENGVVYHLRPHKLGFAGKPPQVYCRYLLKDRPEKVVISEGEFKTAALIQEGIPSVALPGISIFGGIYFEELVGLLRQFGVKEPILAFDNEVKDTPGHPKYKERPEERYDTQRWAYLMAFKLQKENSASFNAKVACIPDEWRLDGKADWDSALAAGKSGKDFQTVVDGAVLPSEYMASLQGEAKRVVKRKVAWYFKKPKMPIERVDNKYIVTKNKGKDNEHFTIVSNFVVNIKSTFYTADGAIRNVQMVNEHGDKSDTFLLDPSEMAGVNNWKTFCYSKGNYIFHGTANDLNLIWEYEFARNPGDPIHQPEQIGRIKPDLWLFANMVIHKGVIITPDNDGVFWIDGYGYKPQALDIDYDGKPTHNAIPTLSDKKINIKEVAEKMQHCVGGYEAYLGIGWVIGTIFSEDIFKKYKCFPFIFPHGVKGSGKTSFLRWIMAFFGIDTEGYNLPESSTVYITRVLSYFSSLGVWFDEYRNKDRDVEKKAGYLRSAYNRQSTGKGIKKAFGTKGYRVTGTMTVSGQELPHDAGLFSRLVPMQFSVYKRNRLYFDWLNKNYLRFSNFTLDLILNYDKYRDRILENIEEMKRALILKGIEDRTAENWAIVAACFDTVVLQDDDFISWVVKSCQEWKLIEEDSGELNQFFDDVNVMLAKKEINNRFISVDIVEGGKKVLNLWFNGLYNVWAERYRKKTGRDAFDKGTILKYLQDEPYYVGYHQNKVTFGGDRRRPHVIDVDKGTEVIQEIAETVDSLGV